jgi:hypothetical protein
LRAKRSNPGFRRRSGADFVAYCPPAAGDAETMTGVANTSTGNLVEAWIASLR